MNVDQLPVLFRREFQEQRASFLIVPFVVAAFLVVMILFGLFVVEFVGQMEIDSDIRIETDEGVTRDMRRGPVGPMFSEELMAFAAAPRLVREQKMAGMLDAFAKPVLLALWFVVFFYLLSTLYDDRKDRSILFWKSMPVSDATTVISKLLMAGLLAPAVYLVAVIVVHLVFLGTVSVAAMGYPVDIIETLWAPSNLLMTWLSLAVYFIYVLIWSLPFYGWLLLVSSFARSIPFVWAIGVPLGIVVVDKIFMNGAISEWMGRHLADVGYDGYKIFHAGDAARKLITVDFLLSVIIGAGLLYGAVLMRGRGDEI